MSGDPLPQLVEDLVRVGVGVRVLAGRPSLVYDPADPRAAALVRRTQPALAERRDEAVALFARLGAVSEPTSESCPACGAVVYLGGWLSNHDVVNCCDRLPCHYARR